jgi:hypothetical protein
MLRSCGQPSSVQLPCSFGNQMDWPSASTNPLAKRTIILSNYDELWSEDRPGYGDWRPVDSSAGAAAKTAWAGWRGACGRALGRCFVARMGEPRHWDVSLRRAVEVTNSVSGSGSVSEIVRPATRHKKGICRAANADLPASRLRATESKPGISYSRSSNEGKSKT